MKTEAAIVWAAGEPWSVEEIELDPPKTGEVLVRLAASGMCHSDEHVRSGDLGGAYPTIGGHEGAGVVEEVGPGVEGLAPGDHVVFGFVAACGTCPSCARGRSSLCDVAAVLMLGAQADGTYRHHSSGGVDLPTMTCLGTFARHTVVNQASCVKILDHYPLDKACLVGCGVTTGWGSAVYAGEVRPGDDVVVIGIGGLGAAAVQGARLAGAERIFAIDPVPFKLEMATKFGATHTAASIAEALPLVNEVTWGKNADKVICTMGLGDGALMESIMQLTAKRGRVVVTNIHPMAETKVTLSLVWLTLMEKQIVGTIFGSANFRYDIPHLLRLYDQGQLDLDSMVTQCYRLEEVNQGYADMLEGRNIRGVLLYED
ncbi:MAG: NDMA-dependent alcohol dehydrogenase [Acidimicrobiales bacterium]|jgi:S-(hydroxymethyl)glutathione dehydrogenase/alcohol dehydrogenase